MNVSILVKLIDAVSGPARRVSESAVLATKSLEVAGKKADELFKSAGNLRLASEGVGNFARGAMGFVREPIKLASDFEEVMRRVGSRARLSAEQMTGLTNEAMRIGSTTQSSSTKAAEAMLLLARSGRDARGIMQTLPGVLNIVEASGLELAASTELVTETMNSFRLGSEQSGRIADVLVSTSQRSSATVQELAQTFMMAAPMANALGLSFENTAAMAGLLANANIKGGRAGEMMKAMMQGLIRPSQEAGIALRYLGLGRMDSQTGQIKKLDVLLGEIADKTKGMNSGKKTRLVNMIFGESAPAVMALLAQGTRGIKEFTAEYQSSSGLAERVAQEAGGGTKDAAQTFTNAVNTIKLTLGQALLPALQEAAGAANPLIAKLGELTREHPKLTAAMMGTVGAAGVFASGLHGVLETIVAVKALGGFGALASGIAGFAKTITLQGIPAVLAFTAALLTNPLVLVTMAVVGLVAGIVALVKNWEWVQGVVDRFNKASAGTKAILSVLLAPLLALAAPFYLIAKAARAVIDNWEPIKAFFSGLFDSIGEGVNKALKFLEPLLDNPLVNALIVQPAKMIATGAKAIGGFASAVASEAGTMAKEIGGIVTGPSSPSADASAARSADASAAPTSVETLTQANARTAAKAPALGDFSQTQRVDGEVRIRIESDAPTRVLSTRARGGIDLKVDSGLALGAP